MQDVQTPPGFVASGNFALIHQEGVFQQLCKTHVVAFSHPAHPSGNRPVDRYRQRVNLRPRPGALRGAASPLTRGLGPGRDLGLPLGAALSASPGRFQGVLMAAFGLFGERC